MNYSVGELAKLAGVSIRTLHHYDEVGLLTPSHRTAARYRQYTPADVERLQRILVYRSLGFDLSRIASMLDDPAVDALEHLRRQRDLLLEQRDRLHGMIAAVEAMMDAKKKGYAMTPDEMREVFGAFDPAAHEAEAEARWGETEAWAESRRRTARYGKQDWVRMKEEAEQIEAGLAELMGRGVAATSTEAMDLAEQHRQHIGRWFYPCSHRMHTGLADMYTADPRFAAHYDTRAEGLSGYVREAVLANAARAETGSE